MTSDVFSFELADKDAPDVVVGRLIEQIDEATRGYVQANIAEYDGPIQSYVKRTGLFSAIEAFQTTTDTVDIQQDLGEQSEEHHRYEVYLSVAGLEHYKYRILFMDYGAISYPLIIVLNEMLAVEYTGQKKDIFSINTMKELEEMIDGIINSKIMIKLIQSLINESLRQKNRRETMAENRKKDGVD